MQSEEHMRANQIVDTKIRGTDWAMRERQAMLRGLHRAKVRPVAAVTSGWGIDVAGCDPRSVHASLHGKGDLRVSWWNLYSRVYLAVVPGANVERAMYSFHRMHHTLTLGWLGYLTSVRTMTRDIQQRGVLAAVKTAVTSGYSVQP
jgi:hypothetical protein